MLEGLSKPVRVFPCAVRSVSETLDDKDKAILLDAVMDHSWKMSALESALAAKGLVLSQGSIKRHRFGECSCSKI